MAPAAKEQESGGRKESKEEINKGEKDEMTTESMTPLFELGADVFLSSDLPATEKQGISYKKKTIPSFFPPSFFPSSINMTHH